ncbi:hypothetical protein ILUMI_10571 [Ignelater luminosus]|uniref:Secreted protein n=1 Tax=Ignelater luminosus TaxID=2038154 RepID=A0A8K0G8J9_IGNLU|nr:hypothetical protein ILUMI_10571 [Ignelater luminosus]
MWKLLLFLILFHQMRILEACNHYSAKLRYKNGLSFRARGCIIKCKTVPKFLMDEKVQSIIVFSKCIKLWEFHKCTGQSRTYKKGYSEVPCGQVTCVSHCKYKENENSNRK